MQKLPLMPHAEVDVPDWHRLLLSRQPLHAGVTQRPLVQVCPLLHATHELPLLPHALVLVPAGEGHARI